MNCYEEMVDQATLAGLQVIEKYFKSAAKGLCKGNKIGISKAIETDREKRCVLAEEIAHSLYTSGDILDLNDTRAYKEELHIRNITYESLVPINELIQAYMLHQYDCYEIADHLNVTDEFLHNALRYYSRKYGGYKRHGKFVINFLPLIICERSHNSR